VKHLLLIAALCFSSAFAFAQFDGGFNRPGQPGREQPGRPGYPGQPGRPGYPGQPGYPGRGPIQCSATDKGWEEHGGGHASCGECLRRHGSCIETCGRTYYVCQAEGMDRQGRRFIMEGRADSRYIAQDDAMRACYYYRYQNCHVTSCSQDREVTSRRSCR